MDNIDISGKGKAVVLAALYNSARQQSLGDSKHGGRDRMLIAEAQVLIDGRLAEVQDLHFDDIRGRVLKVDITGDAFDPGLYDRDNGEGAAARAIEQADASASFDAEAEPASSPNPD